MPGKGQRVADRKQGDAAERPRADAHNTIMARETMSQRRSSVALAGSVRFAQHTGLRAMLSR